MNEVDEWNLSPRSSDYSTSKQTHEYDVDERKHKLMNDNEGDELFRWTINEYKVMNDNSSSRWYGNYDQD